MGGAQDQCSLPGPVDGQDVLKFRQDSKSGSRILFILNYSKDTSHPFFFVKKKQKSEAFNENS